MTDDPWHYIEAHQYDRAIRAYDSQLLIEPNASANWVNRSIALLCQSRTSEALDGLLRGQQLIKDSLPGTGGSFSELIATTHYLNGDVGRAIEQCKSTIDGLRSKSIWYADAAGGVTLGLLLYYFSLQRGQKADVDFSIKWLKGRSRRKAYTNWPGPLADLIMDKTDMESCLTRELGASDLGELTIKSASDIYIRKTFMSGLFYGAVVARRKGDENRHAHLMATCACLENPHLDPEWYLARRELGMDFWWKPKVNQN